MNSICVSPLTSLNVIYRPKLKLIILFAFETAVARKNK